MPNQRGLGHLILSVLRKILYFWVRTQVLPQDISALDIDPQKPVVYVLQRQFLPSALVLSKETENLGMPPAWGALALADGRQGRSFFFLSRPESSRNAKKEPYSLLLRRLVAVARAHPQFEVQIVPVSILWGRAPNQENSILKLIFADGWPIRGGFKQMLTVLLHGRHTLVRFNAPLSLRQLVDEGLDEARTLRKLARVLRVHFRRQREMAIGPDLSHRRTQIDALLAAPTVRAAIMAQAAEAPVKTANAPDKQASAKLKATLKASAAARAYAWEIASDYSYPIILIFSRFMTWVWTRLYDGVEVSNFDTVTSVASDHEIIYVPCHRSHIDYLLMSYIVFHHGLMVPHIAAGANLNLPVIGGILRRSGAFFLRRSFKGNHVYAAVFNEYLHMLISKGYPIEYFVEGGRSRTGRLLAPMGGMLMMTLQSFLRDAKKPIVFLPVYIGYEKLFEGRTYVGELLGRPKKKESLLDLLLTVRELKKDFGKVHVNFGEPIKLAEVLDAVHADWRSEPVQEGERAPWLGAGINSLMRQIADRINAAAVANPVNLISLALLATPRHAMDAQQLARQLDGYRQLAEAAPYAPRIKITQDDGATIIAYCEKLKLIQRQPHPLGDVLYFTADDAVLSTYTRNNILHLYAVPALLACLFSQNDSISTTQLRRLAKIVYPFMRAELFLRWADEELDDVLQSNLAALQGLGWLVRVGQGDCMEGEGEGEGQSEGEGKGKGEADGGCEYAAPDLNSDEFAQLSLLGQTLRPSLMRYFITLAMLTQQGSGNITPAALESLCHLQAQRLSLLREFNAPEFFDKTIFRTMIATLTGLGQAQICPDGKIVFDGELSRVASMAHFVLPPDVRQTILYMARQDGEKAAEMPVNTGKSATPSVR
jgi:glycerol-3-phosphate O-acyltransferase